MNDRLDVMSLTQPVDGPPVKRYLDGNGGSIEEECSQVGWCDLPADRDQYLSDLGVDLTYAEYDPDTMRWERCLFSEGVADLLEDLHAEGDFPYAFESGPSQGELEWLEAAARGATERPELPLYKYLVPAQVAGLAALADSDGDVASPGSSRSGGGYLSAR